MRITQRKGVLEKKLPIQKPETSNDHNKPSQLQITAQVQYIPVTFVLNSNRNE